MRKKQILTMQYGKYFSKDMCKLRCWEQRKKDQTLPLKLRKALQWNATSDLDLQGWLSVDQIVTEMNTFQTKLWSCVWSCVYRQVKRDRGGWEDVEWQMWRGTYARRVWLGRYRSISVDGQEGMVSGTGEDLLTKAIVSLCSSHWILSQETWTFPKRQCRANRGFSHRVGA